MKAITFMGEELLTVSDDVFDNLLNIHAILEDGTFMGDDLQWMLIQAVLNQSTETIVDEWEDEDFFLTFTPDGSKLN